MRQVHEHSLDRDLLARWRNTPGSDGHDANAPDRRKARVAYRPGYRLFKLLLVLSLFFGLTVLLPWALAHAGSPLGVEAGGYMYVSIPLKATEPQYDEASLRVDLVGEGVHVIRLEMAQKTGKTRVLSGRHRPRDWRRLRDAIKSNRPRRTFELPDQAPRRARVRSLRDRSPRARYLALLTDYRSSSSSEKSAIYPQLVAAYRRAIEAR